MDRLTSPKQRAATDALELLHNANVLPDTFTSIHIQSLQNTAENYRRDEAFDLQPSPVIQKALNKPVIAVYYTELQHMLNTHRVTHKSYLSALVDHPEGAVNEYPESGSELVELIAH